MTMLDIRDITKRFGGLVANDSIAFTVEAGQIFAVIGPNGAGKTTLFNMVAGTFPPSEGEVAFDGAVISGRSVAEIAQSGLVRTYQLVQLFKQMTVAENVMVGFHRVTTGGVFSALVRPPGVRRQEREIREKTAEILEFVGLSHRADVTADLLPYGEQRLLEVARALAAGPKLLLLDEPAAGLNTEETAELARVVRKVNENGVTIMLIEHDMGLVMQIAHRIAVLDFGRKIAEGTPEEIRAHPEVIAAYLGGTEGYDD
ncbi:ABC transporter ATP-binding protein [Acidimangrovimonas sediminis]|uniref:ABC transporter ATP-binding protein n=1 Tax=Acidimangrovimonas sediminis TaxID=2056283 RepID=UPI000C7F8B06|nr:ABC transporter ATP-binding protein [Acidimangrovimonas sediminis]